MLFVIVFVGLSSISIGWALATPLGGSIDEPSHMIRAEAVARGQLLQTRVDARGYGMFEVSTTTAGLWDRLCYAFDRTQPASCATPLPDDGGTAWVASGASKYDPLYYAIVGWPVTLIGGPASLYAMRITSALLCSLCLAFAVAGAATLRWSRIAVPALLLGVTPMVIALDGAVNPNSLEIAAGAAFYVGTLLVVRRPTRRVARVAVVGASIAAVLLANARSISPLWLVILGVVGIVMGGGRRWRLLLRRPGAWVVAGASVLGAAVSTGWTIAAASLATDSTVANGPPFWAAAEIVLRGSFDYTRQWIGMFGWGYIPTPAPVAFGLGALLFCLVLAALVVGSGAARVSTAILAAVLVLSPALIQGVAASGFGFIWQGRYDLVLLPPLVLTSGLALTRRLRPVAAGLRRPATWTVGIVFGVSQLASILVTLRQFAVGQTGWGRFLTAPAWTPPGGLIAPLTLASIGVVLIVAAMALRGGSGRLGRPRSRPDPAS